METGEIAPAMDGEEGGWRAVKAVVQMIRRMRSSGLLWLTASAVLFLLGASTFSGIGMKEAAAVGVFSAIAAVAMIIAFFG